MKIFELEINKLHSQILTAKMTQFCLKILPFVSLIELIFRNNFQLSIFKLQESSKRCLIFSTSLRFLRNE